MHILTLTAAIAPEGEDWEVLAEGCAANYTGNFRDIARRLISTCQGSSKEAATEGEVRRSYSADKHTFDYILHLPTMLLFLSLSDDDSTTRETFRYLEVIKNTVLGATRDLSVASYFPHQPHTPLEMGSVEARKGYAGTVRTAFRSAVVQYLRETASRMNFPDSPYDAFTDLGEGAGAGGEGGGQPNGGGTTVAAGPASDNGWQRFSFQRCTSGTSTATGSSTTTEEDGPLEGVEEGFTDLHFTDDKNPNPTKSTGGPSRRIASDSGIRPTVPPLTSAHSTGALGTATATHMGTGMGTGMGTAGGTGAATGGVLHGLLPPPPDSLRTLSSRKQCTSYDSGLQQLRGRGASASAASDAPPLLPPPPSPPMPSDAEEESPKPGATVRIRGLRVRKSREEKSGLERQGSSSSTASGGGAWAGAGRDEELPHVLKVKVKPTMGQGQGEGQDGESNYSRGEQTHASMILLPLDYSGMADEEGECLLKAMDVQVKNALQAQVNIAQSVDAFLTLLHMFRDVLKDIPLPPPTSVDLKQALKDAQREAIVLNGKIFKGDAEGLEKEMMLHVQPFASAETVPLLCQDIMRASSRTASGGDSYTITMTLLCKRGNLLTPAQVESSPISISISREGVVEIIAENAFALHRNMMPDDDDAEHAPAAHGEGHAQRRPHARKASKILELLGTRKPAPAPAPPYGHGGEGGGGGDNPEAAEGGADLILTTVLEVRLNLLERSSRRRLRIRSAEVEKCPPKYLALGSGEPDVNGSYTLKGFRNRAPWYENSEGVVVTKEPLPPLSGAALSSPGLLGRMDSSPSKGSHSHHASLPTWSIMQGPGASHTHPPGNGNAHAKVYYVQRSSVALLPPCESWEVAGDDIRDPPPTLMPNFTAPPQPPNAQRRAQQGALLKRSTTSGEEAGPRDRDSHRGGDGRRNSVGQKAAHPPAPVRAVDLSAPPPPQSQLHTQAQQQQQQQQQGGGETRDTRRNSLSKAAISAFLGTAAPSPSQAPLRTPPPPHTGGAGQPNAAAPSTNTRRVPRFF